MTEARGSRVDTICIDQYRHSGIGKTLPYSSKSSSKEDKCRSERLHLEKKGNLILARRSRWTKSKVLKGANVSRVTLLDEERRETESDVVYIDKFAPLEDLLSYLHPHAYKRGACSCRIPGCLPSIALLAFPFLPTLPSLWRLSPLKKPVGGA